MDGRPRGDALPSGSPKVGVSEASLSSPTKGEETSAASARAMARTRSPEAEACSVAVRGAGSARAARGGESSRGWRIARAPPRKEHTYPVVAPTGGSKERDDPAILEQCAVGAKSFPPHTTKVCTPLPPCSDEGSPKADGAECTRKGKHGPGTRAIMCDVSREHPVPVRAGPMRGPTH